MISAEACIKYGDDEAVIAIDESECLHRGMKGNN